MDTKTGPAYIYKRPSSDLGHIQTESEGWKKTFYANAKQKKAGVAILTLDKIELKDNYKTQ